MSHQEETPGAAPLAITCPHHFFPLVQIKLENPFLNQQPAGNPSPAGIHFSAVLRPRALGFSVFVQVFGSKKSLKGRFNPGFLP